MDDLLPSYESVIQQNHWELVARYLPSKELCSAALVCHKWHETFTPQLWGNPASHFGIQNDTVYVALTRFKRTLLYARLHVRELTHTLHLPPAHAELYGGPHDEWLRDCLERLPHLQSLIVNGLPFYDHASLLMLRHPSLWWRSVRSDAFPSFGLRLLDASECANATSFGLLEALSHFPDLVSLDLSRTPAAKDESVLDKLRFLPNLRILKLRGLGLKDSDMETIAPAIATRVRSLDVRENHLSDVSARLLLEYCLKDYNRESHAIHMPTSPVEHAQPRGENDIFGTDDLHAHIRKRLTEGFVGSLAIEQTRNAGITHLYLSRNDITVEGVSGLLRSRRLQMLDIGSLPNVLSARQFSDGDDKQDLRLPGVEKLTPILQKYAFKKLVYLNINYSIVTEDAPAGSLASPRAEMVGDLAGSRATEGQELGASGTLPQELHSSSAAIFELPGDTIKHGELPQSSSFASLPRETEDSTCLMKPSQAPTIEVTAEVPEIKRGPAYAPEPVVLDEAPLSPINPLIDATGGLSPISPIFEVRPRSITAGINFSDSVETPPRRTSAYFVEDRRARLDLRLSQENTLHPGMLPKMHTLVLTDVPTQTKDYRVIARLIQFMKDCAEEYEIARLRAKHTYILPPGRSRIIAEREYARNLFALRRIILEMAPPPAATKKVSTSWRQYPTKSSTEDADSEAFWEAATHDFSFFGDEECGLPTVEPGRRLPLAAMDGLMLASDDLARPTQPPEAEAVRERTYDVVAEISRYRKSGKADYRALLQAGETDPIVEGNWPGDVTVVRPPMDLDGGSTDYYGNRYQAGWLYR